MDLSDLKSFAQSLKEKFTIADASSPEDQLKFPVTHLLEAAGNRYDLTVQTKTETYLYEPQSSPRYSCLRWRPYLRVCGTEGPQAWERTHQS